MKKMLGVLFGFFVICEPFERDLEIKLNVRGWPDRAVYYAVYFDMIPDALQFMAKNQSRFERMTLTRQETP